MDHDSGVVYPNVPPQSDGRDQATAMPEYVHAKFQNIIRIFRHQDWLREFSPPKLKNRGPRLLDDDTPWFDWPETVSSWEAFCLYRTGRSLGIPSLVKFVSTRWIAEKILHAGELSSSVGIFDSDPQSRTQRSLTKDGGQCVCAHCVCSAPRVLLFSLEEDIKDRELEYVARQKLIGVFGVGWCTSEFASLPRDISESVLIDLLKRVTPQNSLSLHFAAEKALQTLARSHRADSPTLRRILTTARGRIEDIICKELELCFESPEWETLVESCRLSKDPMPESVDKLKWVFDAISRVGHVKVSEGDGPCYLDKLHHLLLKLLPADIHSSKALPRPFPDNNAQGLRDSIFQSATNTLVVNVTPPDYPGDVSPLPERPPSNFRSLNSVCSSQGVTESILYSHASSRTISTDYGRFYTRHALDWSTAISPLGEKIPLSPTKKDAHESTSQTQSVISTFQASKSGGSKFISELSWLPATFWEDEDKLSRLEYSGNSLEVSESISTSYHNYRLSSTASSSMSYHQSPSSSRTHRPHTTSDIDSVELAVESSLAWVLQQMPFRAYSQEIQQHLCSTKTYSITNSGTFHVNGEGQGEVAASTGVEGHSKLPREEPSVLFSFLTMDEENSEINHIASSTPLTTADTHRAEEHPLILQQKIAEIESTVETLKAELSQRDAQLCVYRSWVERIKEEKKYSDDVNELMDALVLADYPMQISRLREISDEMDYFDNDDDI